MSNKKRIAKRSPLLENKKPPYMDAFQCYEYVLQMLSTVQNLPRKPYPEDSWNLMIENSIKRAQGKKVVLVGENNLKFLKDE